MTNKDTDKIIADYYASHPDEAADLGYDLLRQDSKERKEAATMDALAASGTGPSPYKYYFQFKFLDEVGLSWWKWELMLTTLDAGVWLLGLPNVLHAAIYVLMVIILIKRMP